MSFIKSKSKLVYIKKTKFKKGYKHWFWHKGAGGICGRQGMKKCDFNISPSGAPLYKISVTEKEREIQVGDTVFVINDRIFATVVSDIDGDLTIYTNYSEEKVVAQKEILFVSPTISNFKNNQLPDKNLFGAQQPCELDFFEKYMATKAILAITQYFPHIKISEKTMRFLYKIMFSEIYEWAGEYRKEKHELVVGKREGATLEADKVKKELKHFFKMLNAKLSQASKNRGNLVDTLVFLNKELCWIHPFRDGNGRTIRLLSEILAIEWGYLIDWGFKDNKKAKRSYHQAIRRSLHKSRSSDKQLRIFIASCLKEAESENS